MALKRNKELAKKYSEMPCCICGSRKMVSGHHVISFKSRPDLDIDENIIPLCFKHHREIHDNGRNTFINKYAIQDMLFNRGFEFDTFTERWFLNV